MADFGKHLSAMMALVMVISTMMAAPAQAEDWVQGKDSPDAAVTLGPLPQGWTLGGSNVAEYAAGACTAERWAGQTSGALVSTGFNFAGGAYLAQSIDAAAYQGQRVRLTAHVKTVDVRMGASLWLSGTGIVTTAPVTMVQGSTDWQAVSVEANIPVDARRVSFGAWLTGRGKVFISGLKLDVIRPDEVAQTPAMSFGG